MFTKYLWEGTHFLVKLKLEEIYPAQLERDI